MSVNPAALYSIIAVISTSFVGLAIFFYCKKHFSFATGPFFKNYIIGFFILGLGFTFHLMINLGFEIKYPLYAAVFLASQFAIIFANLLFYRGTVMLGTRERFITTIFPLIVLPTVAIITICGLLVIKVNSFIMFTVIRWGFLMPIKAFLASIFLYYFFKGSGFDTVKRKFHTLFLGSIWFVSLGMELYLWFTLASYPQEFWSLKLASLTGWYIVRAVVYLFTLVAILLYSNHLTRISQQKELKAS